MTDLAGRILFGDSRVLALPEADPSIATDGHSLGVSAGIGTAFPDLMAIFFDLTGGTTPELSVDVWLYFENTGNNLTAWQKIKTIQVSDSLANQPTFHVIPTVGASRIAVIAKTSLGAPTGVSYIGKVVTYEQAAFFPQGTSSSRTLADVTNGADGTYYYYIDMEGYRESVYQLELNGGSGTVTVTVEGSVQNDGTAADSCEYDDVTSATFGSASFTSSTTLVDNASKLAVFKYVRIKVVAATGAADDADWTIYHRRLPG